MLNEEELEKVNGGRMVRMEDGKLRIFDEKDQTCDGDYYKGWVTGGFQMCRDCDYYRDGYCTNKNAWDELLRDYGV